MQQQVHDILQKANANYKKHHYQHRAPHKFKMGDKVWFHFQKENLQGHPIFHAFELSIPPFLGLHLIFNVGLLRPYFPPLLDALDTSEHLAPTKLDPNCIQYETIDQIMDTKMKGTHQLNIQLYRVVKAGRFLHQSKWLTRSQIQQKFPHLMEEIDAMKTISS